MKIQPQKLPLQLSLQSHLQFCQSKAGTGFTLRCWMERLHATVAPRFATVIVGSVALLGLTTWLVS